MKKVVIYCEGGTTWHLHTGDTLVQEIKEWLRNPKSKDFLEIVDQRDNRKVYLRKQKVNMMVVDESEGGR